MAVEDAAALAEALSFATNHKMVPETLAVFEKVRAKRTSQMQQASLMNGKIWHFEDGPEQEARDAGMRNEVEGQDVQESPNQWTDPVTQAWAYGFDAITSVRVELEDMLNTRPEGVASM